MNGVTTFESKPAPGTERYRSLAGIESVKLMLVDYDEDELIALAFDELKLGPVWNIAKRKARARELRFLTSAIRRFKLNGGRRPQKISEAEILREILPQTGKPFFSGKEIQKSLNCSSTHLMNLISERSLRTQPGRKWHSGTGGSPLITRVSFEQFLTARRDL